MEEPAEGSVVAGASVVSGPAALVDGSVAAFVPASVPVSWVPASWGPASSVVAAVPSVPVFSGPLAVTVASVGPDATVGAGEGPSPPQATAVTSQMIKVAMALRDMAPPVSQKQSPNCNDLRIGPGRVVDGADRRSVP